MEKINQTLNLTVNESLNQTAYLSNFVPFAIHPAVDIFIITLFVSLFTTLINKYMTDQIKIKALRGEMKNLSKKYKDLIRKNPKKAQEIQKEIMKKNFENMKEFFNMKIILITMLPLLFVFLWVKKAYSPFGDFLPLGFFEFGWFGTYLLFAIVNSIWIKKVLDVA